MHIYAYIPALDSLLWLCLGLIKKKQQSAYNILVVIDVCIGDNSNTFFKTIPGETPQSRGQDLPRRCPEALDKGIACGSWAPGPTSCILHDVAYCKHGYHQI